MLLHGLTCNAAYWLRVIPLLGGLRAVALDFRGHGLSAPAFPPRGFTQVSGVGYDGG